MNSANHGVAPLKAIIVGAGFAGIGMAIALRCAGVEDFIVLERGHDVGGVWRDNSYPGAACDVPSHLYSFSFEPNPDWSRMFAPQKEIHAYLQNVANKYALRSKIRFGAEVARATYDEAHSLWRVVLKDGTLLEASLLISGVGQLSRPALPTLPGIETFKGRAFHSARWEHDFALAGKRVAVVGTGASATQFVPAIADKVEHMKVFQRSPSHIMPRPDRAYGSWEKKLFRALPWTTKLHRAQIYLKYESRAIAFTRFKGLMKFAVGRPFRKLLAEQVPNPQTRAQLTPDYQIGCKRVLLSSDYLAAISKPNVELVTTGIQRVTESGIETTDGAHHEVDAIIYGTGFAATEFLAPMQITGRNGLDLNDAWRSGASAYLGMTVPGFPNFFMLYGPNTNLGHNSIIYMLESQIAHIMRCVKAMQASSATQIEVEARHHDRYNLRLQRQLLRTVWNGCKSWYVDANGHNSTNWSGFTLSYRWLTRLSSLHAYRITRPLAEFASGVAVTEPAGWFEKLNATSVRLLLRTGFRTLIGPPFGARAQRRSVAVLASLMPGVGGLSRRRVSIGDMHVEQVESKNIDATQTKGAILYLHGGAFCLGNARSHRSITTRLAKESGLSVWLPEYRLAPEHPYPAALDDALSCYDAMRAKGYAANQIVIAGDSAGGGLALMLALALRDRGDAVPAGLALISPFTDPELQGATLETRKRIDPMVRRGWLEQGLAWFDAANSDVAHQPLRADLRGLSPMLVQVGDEEILLSDSTRLADRAAACGVPCRLEIHMARWHVFHLEAFYLRSARAALRSLASFTLACSRDHQTVREALIAVSRDIALEKTHRSDPRKTVTMA